MTPEYEAMFKANLEDQRAGGQGTNATSTCLAPGMPMVMNAHSPMEIIVLPETTYIRVDHIRDTRRRIYTDGRDWPAEIEPTFDGYSIGKWIDTDGDGRFDVLEVETRGFKGPRSYDASGLPLHRDNQSVFKERIYLDKANPNLLHDDITVIDNGLTRPWTVYQDLSPQPGSAADLGRVHLRRGPAARAHRRRELHAERRRLLMPTRKGQPPPDLRYFSRR